MSGARLTTTWLVVTAAALALLAASAASAEPAFTLRHVAVGRYPTVGLVVRSANPHTPPPVYENGQRITGATYHNLGTSKAIVIAVDHSISMTGDPLTEAGKAADALLQRKRQLDQVQVVTFGSTALAQTSFSQSTIDADAALRGLSPDSKPGTALYDAVVLSAANLEREGSAGRVLVLLTDGHDVRSLASFKEALRTARRADVVVYTVALGKAAKGALRRLASGTGGSFYPSPTPATLASIYRRIGAELNHIWNVTYTTTARPGEQITVSVGRKNGSSMSVQLPGKPSTPYNPLIPSALLRNGVGVLALALVVGLLFFLAVSRLRAVPESERRKQRVRDHTERTPGSEAQERATLAGLIAGLNTRLRGLPRFERIERLVETAAVPASAATIVAASVVLAFVLSLFVAVLTTSAFLTIVFFLLGLAGPILFLRMLARRRVRAFEDQLPDVLAAIASSLRVGHGLKQSLQAVASEGAPPMSIELRRVLAEARLGRPLEEALVAMCERLGSDDLIYVATAVDVQSQVGGSLAGVFETVSETVRERQQHRRRVRALTATGRATAIVMSVMPFAFLFFLLLIAPHYVTPFLTSHIGRVLMVLSVLSIGIGAFLLNRIVSVKT